jgi:hypothetical protein
MKSAEISAIIAENPDAEFAEKPGVHDYRLLKIRGLSLHADRQRWTARERLNINGEWTPYVVSSLYGPRTWTPGQLVTAAQAEQLLEGRRAAQAKQDAARQAERARAQARRNDAAELASQLQARGIACTSSDAGILLQPDAVRELLARLERGGPAAS